MKLCLLLVVVVLVGLASSKSKVCKKNEYELSDTCEEHCKFKDENEETSQGICRVSSIHKFEFGEVATQYFQCWKCFYDLSEIPSIEMVVDQ